MEDACFFKRCHSGDIALKSFTRRLNRQAAAKPAPQKQKRMKSRVTPNTLFSECMEKGPYSTVRASDVARFMCSPFSLWCDRFADRSEQDPPDPILDELARRGNAHESMVLDGEQPGAVRVEPESKPEEIGGMNVQIDGNSNEESFLLGIEAMMGGAKTISKAMLFCLPDGMVGIPDILRRTSGRSAFGQHHYTVVEIKSARTITPAHKLQAAFYAALIGRIQGRMPGTFQMINGNGACEELMFDDYRNALDCAVEGIRRVYANNRPPAVFGRGLHPWISYTNRMAIVAGNVTLVSGVGSVTMERLKGAGITTVDGMISAGIGKVGAIRGIGAARAAAFMESALALSGNTAVRRRTARHTPPKSRAEMFLDLEGRPGATSDDAAVYLIGLLVRMDGEDEYFSFVEADSGPKRMVQAFIKFVAGKEFPIYHWGHYDRVFLTGMMEKYGIAAPALVESILVDLHPVAARSFAFPMSSINLKSLAGWMGFRWANSDIDAFNSYELYRSYRRQRKSSDLELVLNYNRDDCRAAAVVKDWLVKNSETAPA